MSEKQDIQETLFRMEQAFLKLTEILQHLYQNDQIILELLKRQEKQD